MLGNAIARLLRKFATPSDRHSRVAGRPTRTRFGVEALELRDVPASFYFNLPDGTTGSGHFTDPTGVDPQVSFQTFAVPDLTLNFGGRSLTVVDETGQDAVVGYLSGTIAGLDAQFALSPAVGPYVSLVLNYGEVAVLDDQGNQTIRSINFTSLPVVTVQVVSAAEEADALTGYVRFARTGSTSSPLMVSYSVGGAATQGSDFQPLTGTIEIAAGASFVDLPIVPRLDNLVEDDEVVAISVVPSATGDYTAASGAAELKIVDDPPIVWVEDASASVDPGSSGEIVIRRAGGDFTQPLTVNLDIGPGDIQGPAGSPQWDAAYRIVGPTSLTPGSNTLTFAANQETIILTVLGLEDGVPENTGSVRLALTSGAGYRLTDYNPWAELLIRDQLLVDATQVPPPPDPNALKLGAKGPFQEPGVQGITTLDVYVSQAVGYRSLGVTALTKLVPPGGKLLNARIRYRSIQLAAQPLAVINLAAAQAGENRQAAATQDLAAANALLTTAFAGGRHLQLLTSTNPTGGSVGLVLQDSTIPQRTVTIPIIIPNVEFITGAGTLKYLTVTTATITYDGSFTVGVSVPRALAPVVQPLAGAARPLFSYVLPVFSWEQGP
jgi:hypothetical protein